MTAETVATAETDATPRTRTCSNCSKPFNPSRADAKFCSPACRLKAHRRAQNPSAKRNAAAQGTDASNTSAKRQAPVQGMEMEPSTDTNGTKHTTTDAKARTTERKPSVPYSEAIADIICVRLEAGESLLSICSADDLPSEAAVRKWAADPAHSFSARYARAREAGYLKMADEVIALSDGLEAGTNRFEPGVVQRHRLMVDSRKWVLSKCLPKVFGDRIQADVTSGGRPLASATDLDIAKALAHALAAPALPAPEPLDVIDVEAVPVKPEGEGST
jgi:hypothetical protein